MLINLDDIQEKSKNNDEKMINTNKVIESKIQDLEKLLESNESKKTLLANIDQLLFELDDDLENLKEIALNGLKNQSNLAASRQFYLKTS